VDVIDVAQRLIRTPSPVRDGNEVAVAALIQELLAEAGLPPATVEAAHPDRPNLVVTIDFGAGGSHLALCGHIDTKPVGAADWTVDPYAATVDGDRLYGLGAADMKSAVAAMICAAEQLVRGPELDAGRLSLIFTADEEDGAVYGARHLAENTDLDLDAMIIGEPGGIHDDYDSLHLVSRGLGRFEVTAEARQGHSSLTALLGARNAGVDIARAVAALADDLRPTRPENVDALRDWEVTVNPGLTYSSGFGYGVLPQRMTSVLEIRTLPGMDADRTLEEVRGVLSTTAAATGARYSVSVDDEPRHWLNGTQVRAAEPVVAAVQLAASQVLGNELPLAVFPGTTDTSWFVARHSNLACLPALGPGLLHRAHGADEWVSVEAVRRAVQLYEALTRDYLSRSGLSRHSS
jgi:acetylornithine deacetylase/succinyl-diaminopimelate desuccinylase-like protein